MKKPLQPKEVEVSISITEIHFKQNQKKKKH